MTATHCSLRLPIDSSLPDSKPRGSTERLSTEVTGTRRLWRRPEFDLIVLDEAEPSLRERILGAAPAAVAERTDCPVAIVRDTEG